jgi:lipoyl(octanoyl) transferase
MTIAQPALACRWQWLGTRSYGSVWESMKQFTELRGAQTPDTLLALEHHRVFTLGRAGRREHLLAPGDIPIVESDRGGQVTYHGPGQLIIYTLIDLHRRSISVRQLVQGIEQAIIDLLAQREIVAIRRDGAPGVYVGEAKVAALGLRIRRGRAFHGLSLNVDMDLQPFSRINPCGYENLSIVDLATLGWRTTPSTLAPALCQHLANGFGLEPLVDIATGDWTDVGSATGERSVCTSAPSSINALHTW